MRITIARTREIYRQQRNDKSSSEMTTLYSWFKSDFYVFWTPRARHQRGEIISYYAIFSDVCCQLKTKKK